jgi:hypothetical protein
MPYSSDLPWSDGAVVYTAASVMHEIYGDEAYEILAEWIDWRLPPRNIRSFFGPPGFAWMENIRKPNRPWSPDDSSLYERIIVAPSAIQLAATFAGVDTVNKAITDLSLATRYRHGLAIEYIQALAEVTDSLVSRSLIQWQLRPRIFDWSLEDVDLKRNDSGFNLSFEVRTQSLATLPVEVAVIATGDTLRQVLFPESDAAGTLSFSKQVAVRPKTIIVDPRHVLPDRNRRNNIFSFDNALSRHSVKLTEYPTFRRLSQGE